MHTTTIKGSRITGWGFQDWHRPIWLNSIFFFGGGGEGGGGGAFSYKISKVPSFSRIKFFPFCGLRYLCLLSLYQFLDFLPKYS